MWICNTKFHRNPIRIFVGIKHPDGQQNDTSSLRGAKHITVTCQFLSNLPQRWSTTGTSAKLQLLAFDLWWQKLCLYPHCEASTSPYFTDPYFGKYMNDISYRVHHKYGAVLLLRLIQSQERAKLYYPVHCFEPSINKMRFKQPFIKQMSFALRAAPENHVEIAAISALVRPVGDSRDRTVRWHWFNNYT